MSENQMIKGTVTDPNGNTVSGATVSAVDSKTSTLIATATSDANGNFSMTVPSDGVQLKAVAEPSVSNTDKDSLSLSIGFTAVQASY
jgi:hypothetical protein